MRIWHTKLINVLPREQLIGAWRECSAIAGAIKTKGTPNHILVNFVMDYDFDHFINYSYLIKEEMRRRGYRTMSSVWEKITLLKPDWTELPHNEIYKEKMNEEYFKICKYNLYEKYLCHGIKKEDWIKINEQKNEV